MKGRCLQQAFCRGKATSMGSRCPTGISHQRRLEKPQLSLLSGCLWKKVRDTYWSFALLIMQLLSTSSTTEQGSPTFPQSSLHCHLHKESDPSPLTALELVLVPVTEEELQPDGSGTLSPPLPAAAHPSCGCAVLWMEMWGLALIVPFQVQDAVTVQMHCSMSSRICLRFLRQCNGMALG